MPELCFFPHTLVKMTSVLIWKFIEAFRLIVQFFVHARSLVLIIPRFDCIGSEIWLPHLIHGPLHMENFDRGCTIQQQFVMLNTFIACDEIWSTSLRAFRQLHRSCFAIISQDFSTSKMQCYECAWEHRASLFKTVS